jgi:hypothetical protein
MQILEEPTGPASTSAAPTAAESPPILSPSGQLGNVLRNGDFEQGFQPNGVDDIRLVGPTLAVAASGELVAPGGVVTGSELVAASEMVAIPVTGEAPTTSRSSLPMWVTVAFLSLLLGGATWRLVWKQM